MKKQIKTYKTPSEFKQTEIPDSSGGSGAGMLDVETGQWMLTNGNSIRFYVHSSKIYGLFLVQ